MNSVTKTTQYSQLILCCMLIGMLAKCSHSWTCITFSKSLAQTTRSTQIGSTKLPRGPLRKEPSSYTPKSRLFMADDDDDNGSSRQIPDPAAPCTIKVLGVGGGGGNAVNRMIETRIEGKVQ